VRSVRADAGMKSHSLCKDQTKLYKRVEKKERVAGQFAVKYKTETTCWTKKLSRQDYGIHKCFSLTKLLLTNNKHCCVSCVSLHYFYRTTICPRPIWQNCAELRFFTGPLSAKTGGLTRLVCSVRMSFLQKADRSLHTH
jgi:hypothetical protein